MNSILLFLIRFFLPVCFCAGRGKLCPEAKDRMKRLIVLVLLCAALTPGVRAEGYLLQAFDGQILYRALPDGDWMAASQSGAALIGAHDRALLARGMYLPSRAALTRALEDFCS